MFPKVSPNPNPPRLPISRASEPRSEVPGVMRPAKGCTGVGAFFRWLLSTFSHIQSRISRLFDVLESTPASTLWNIDENGQKVSFAAHLLSGSKYYEVLIWLIWERFLVWIHLRWRSNQSLSASLSKHETLNSKLLTMARTQQVSKIRKQASTTQIN